MPAARRPFMIGKAGERRGLMTTRGRGRVGRGGKAMKFLRHLLVVLIFSGGLAPFATGQQVLKVKIEGKELDRALLFQKLNEHGADHHMKFELANQGWDYRIAYGTGQAAGFTPYGPVVATASVTRGLEGKGGALFTF